jgi:hypothetical protein
MRELNGDFNADKRFWDANSQLRKKDSCGRKVVILSDNTDYDAFRLI